MRWLLILLTILFLTLQFNLWVGKGSLAEVSNLKKSNQALEVEVERMRDQNGRLGAEVIDLKSGYEAVEERARGELGMIRDGETFYQIVEPEPKTGD
ncbi:MAG: cell division protein FtsB [Gammaproteobacteria bacterium]|nr:cell division protein FtsB [Gammaproteobacteria bacterium]MBU1656155.1 cell division protein FtsB [Gammaproteobacteria bacterium]MBU1960804.1 cell division protein FtsB [Gammaproteobacteria bacterium]